MQKKPLGYSSETNQKIKPRPGSSPPLPTVKPRKAPLRIYSVLLGIRKKLLPLAQTILRRGLCATQWTSLRWQKCSILGGWGRGGKVSSVAFHFLFLVHHKIYFLFKTVISPLVPGLQVNSNLLRRVVRFPRKGVDLCKT